MMSRGKKFSGLIFLCLTMYVCGCCMSLNAVNKKEDVEKKISEAQVYFDQIRQIRNVDVGKLYHDDYKESEEKLKNSDKLLKKCKQDDAYLAASESIDASQRILRKIIIGPFKEEALHIKKEIESRGYYSSLKGLIPKLDEIINYAKNLDKNQQEIVTIAQFKPVSNLKEEVDETFENSIDKSYGDIFFKTGRYKASDLSDEGRHKIEEEIVEKIVENKNKLFKKRPNIGFVIEIKVQGFTDEQAFSEDSTVLKLCKKQGASHRKQLNLCLSKLRAEAIGEYIRQRIREYDPNIRINTEGIGRGEELPEGVSRSASDDPKRRICKIECSVIPEK